MGKVGVRPGIGNQKDGRSMFTLKMNPHSGVAKIGYSRSAQNLPGAEVGPAQKNLPPNRTNRLPGHPALL